MNTDILDKYKIQFQLLEFEGNKIARPIQTETTDLNYLLTGYFTQMSIALFIEEIIPELTKAIEGNTFETDGGGGNAFLKIDRELSFLKNENPNFPTQSIPTQDMKEIVLAWVEWITTNDLEKYIL